MKRRFERGAISTGTERPRRRVAPEDLRTTGYGVPPCCGIMDCANATARRRIGAMCTANLSDVNCRLNFRLHSPGLTMKRLLVLCLVLLAAPAKAGQEWELISITRGATWEVNQAKGVLKQNGSVLEGVLNDKTDRKADYQIRVELNGARAEATFRF